MSLPDEAVLPLLSKSDLQELKKALAKDLQGLVEYGELSLLVPGVVRDRALNQATITGRPVWDFERRAVFLPLSLPGEEPDKKLVLAVAVLDQVKDLNRLSRQGAYLGRIGRLSLEKFQLVQDLHLDSLTRLWGRTKFLEELARLLKSISSAEDLSGPSLARDPARPGRLSLVLVGLREPGRKGLVSGGRFPRSLVTGVGRAVGRAGALGSGSGRLSEGVFAWIEPESGGPEVLSRLKSWAKGLEAVKAYDGGPLSAHVFGGVATFPDDLAGALPGSGPDQARELALELESLAGRVLTEAARMEAGPFLTLSEVRARCGRVAEVLPLNRVTIDLGLRERVEEGMTFAVVPSESPQQEEEAKAQLIVLVVRQTQSTAEIVSQDDPGQPVLIGDRLRLLKDGTPIRLVSNSKKTIRLGRERIEVTIDKATGLPSPMSARRIAAAAAGAERAITVLMARIQGLVQQRAMAGQKEADTSLARLAVLGADTLNPLAVVRAGVDSLAFIVPTRANEAGIGLGQRLFDAAREKLDLQLLVGLAGYPFLDKEPAETIDMAAKALDHASFPKADPVVLFDAVSLNVSGDRFYHRGDLDAAVAEYSQALALDPENINIINSLGACYGQMGRLDRAAELFQKAVDLAPEDYMTWFNLGQVRQRQGLKEEALEALERAGRIEPHDFAVRVALGRINLALGRYSRAAEILDQAGASDQASPALYRWLGEALAGSGKPNEAIKVFKKAVKADPGDACSISWLGRLFLDHTNDREVALTLTRQAVDLDKENGLYRNRLAWALLRNDRAEEAAAQFREAINLGQKSAEVLLGAAKADLALGKKEQAEKLLLEAAALSPGDTEIVAELEELSRQGG